MDESWKNVSWNWTEFCGNQNFTIWTSTHQDLTQCFQMLCLQIPILSVIAIASAYYGGKYEEWIIRTSREKYLIKLRLFIVFLLAIIPGIRLMMQVSNDSKSLYAIDYWFTILESFTWFVHLGYISALKNRLGLNLRGPVLIISLWTMFYVVCIIRLRSIYLEYLYKSNENTYTTLMFSIITLALQTFYGFSIIPVEDSPSRRATIDMVDQNDVAFTSLLSQYVRFREDFDPYYLGTAMEGSGFLSQFLYRWVNPLMEKGVKRQLNAPEDVFDLPDHLTCSNLYQKLKVVEDGHISLLKQLHRRFGKEFYGIGILKFIADIAGFASPLLLHELLIYIEDEHIPVMYGYFYGGGIFLASLVGCFCTVHFDFLAGTICLKLRGTLISRIYHKILLLNSSVFSQISIGEIVNHISVDMERIAGSCISFHSVWSIPFQLGVTLYLLYTQIGMAFLAGLVFSIFMIPLNKVVAMKIGKYSKSMMSEKDRRVELMSEVIKGIRVIKLHVWEEYFISKIMNIRAEEIKYLKYRKYLDAVCVYFWATTPVIISILTFACYIFLGGKLNAAVVFTSLSLLNMLIVPLNAFPWVLNGLIESWVSLKRTDSFLKFEETDSSGYDKIEARSETSVFIADGSFVRDWADGRSHLYDINLSIKKGQLIGICGPVGSGKSSLLSVILGEIHKTSGKFSMEDMDSGVGFVSQSPWIQQCSVRDNILFGKPYETAWYKNVVEACALIDDFNNWPNGDFEVVGEGGLTLSGGQKARIALARAVYQDANMYLLDDILSAVDAQVAHHIYQECIQNLLRGKTRILVTHATQFFTSVDWIVMMENCSIVKQGSPANILDNCSENHEKDLIDLNRGTKRSGVQINGIRENGSCEDEIEKEISATGVVSATVYLKYWKCVGFMLGLFILFLVAAMQISRLAVDWWLSVWISKETNAASNRTDLYYLTEIESKFLLKYGTDVDNFLRTYIVFGIINSVFVMMRAFFFAYGGVHAAIVVHKKLLCSISQARMEFFEISPLGRILNRFSSDTNTVDDSLPFDINILLAQLFAVLGTLFVTLYGIPWLGLFIAPLLPFYHWLQNYYRRTSRELKRLVSVTLSPLYSHVNETITGITTIRAMKQSTRFIKENEEKVDSLQKCHFSSLAAQVWLNIRLQMIGVCIIGGVCLISVLQRHFDIAYSSFIGLALSYALTLTSSLGGLVNIFVETEQKMVAMERVNEYMDQVKSEPRHKELDIALPFAWPSQGVITFMNVSLKYRDGVAYSLKNISFETHAGEKIGIVGRTGAGKSSLFSALFRLTEICDGSIYIDAVDISEVPLKKLRSKLTAIPQDPFIFAGTVRSNIDPLNERDDFDLWEAVNRCNILPLITSLGGMNGELQAGGSNLSVGERQLLCLVRAVLRNTKIICIDEATANVDRETDSRIQLAIRNSFRQSTVLTIAHRLQSVLNCDRILVMDHSEVLEFDDPQTLLRDPKSNFFKMYNQDPL